MWWTTVMTISFGFVFQDRAAWRDFSRLTLTPVCSQRFVEISEDSSKRGTPLLASCFTPQGNECCWAAGLIGNRDPYSPRLRITTGDTKLFCVVKGSRTKKNARDRKQKGSNDTSACPQTWKTCEWPKGHLAKASICHHTYLRRTDCIHIDTDTLKGP